MQDSIHMEHNCIIMHAQNATALQPNVLLTVITQLLVTSKRELAFFRAKICQIQLQAPQSVSIINSLTHIIIPTQIWRKQFLPKH